jgi:hypothetical protein
MRNFVQAYVFSRSQDFKYSKDFGEWDNKFWLDNFYTPKDYITEKYRAATDKLNDLLPANFRLTFEFDAICFRLSNKNF